MSAFRPLQALGETRIPADSHHGLRQKACLPMAALLVAMGSISACSTPFGGNPRSTAAFCKELKAGNARMKKTATSASNTATGQLAAAAENYGEYTRLLHRLDKVAPTSIETEMHDVSTAWDKEMAASGDSASNPLGALGSILISAVINSGSTRTVDAFADKHCGLQVF